MLKMKVLSRFLAGAVCSIGLVVSAQAVELPNGQPVSTTDCPQLNTGVTVNLSKNVNAGYVCRAADATQTPPTVNRVGLGTCHTGGTAKSRMVTCSRTSDGGDPPAYTYTPAACTDSNFDANTGQPLAGDPGKVPVTGLTMYSTSTAGGAIGEDGMAATACDGPGISGLVEAAFP